ncbi:limbic system-associated membrane protein-like, partial [Venturia canescens]|uniref:limbic system-associated membrane protein-like n=1 Tax=Venturia canescens TaxID=32260 RepID=UPI001C9CDBE8
SGSRGTQRELKCVHTEGNWTVKNVPTTVEPVQNDTVLLPCYVNDLESPVVVKWWRDGKQLAESGDSDLIPAPRITMHSNNSLQVSRIQPEDTGQYVCEVSRPAPWGRVTQAYAIRVKYPPKVVQAVPESGELEVNLGDEVDMYCVANGYPVPVISWKMKDMDMQLLDDRPRLRFLAENRTLAGRYTCVANNGIGEPAQAVMELRIKHKPEIETKKRWVHVSPGIRTQLDCEVAAWPEAHVDWFFKNEQIVYDSRIVKHTSGQTHSLVIRNVRARDYGYYLCRAANYLGTKEKAIELSGVANPAVIKGSRSVGKNAYYFVWEVDSYSSIIEYQFWFRNYPSGDWHKLFIPSGSDAIGPLHSKSFNLTGLKEATHYEALVLSRNRYGWSGPSKVIRFATEGALPQPDDRYKVGKAFEESATDNNIVILDPMSQHYPTFMEGTKGSSSSPRIQLFVVLSMAFTAVSRFFL